MVIFKMIYAMDIIEIYQYDQIYMHHQQIHYQYLMKMFSTGCTNGSNKFSINCINPDTFIYCSNCSNTSTVTGLAPTPAPTNNPTSSHTPAPTNQPTSACSGEFLTVNVQMAYYHI
eukprot:490125_1